MLKIPNSKGDVKSFIENPREFLRENNKIILKSKQRQNERHVFTEEFNKIVLSSNNDKMIYNQLIW